MIDLVVYLSMFSVDIRSVALVAASVGTSDASSSSSLLVTTAAVAPVEAVFTAAAAAVDAPAGSDFPLAVAGTFAPGFALAAVALESLLAAAGFVEVCCTAPGARRRQQNRKRILLNQSIN